MAELNEQKVADTLGRYKFLLGQTELFAHFMKSKGLDVAALTSQVQKNKEAANTAKEAGRKKGGRKTEKEEDEELLNEEISEEQDPTAVVNTETVFSESPVYIKNGKMRDYQVQGLNWLISLFEHGINGVLADEMGITLVLGRKFNDDECRLG